MDVMGRYVTITEIMRDTWLVQLMQIFQQQEMKLHVDT